MSCPKIKHYILIVFYPSVNNAHNYLVFAWCYFRYGFSLLSFHKYQDRNDSNNYPHGCLHLKSLFFFVSSIGQAVEEHFILP